MATISTLQPLTPAFAQEFATDYVAAWNAHQLERVLAYMTEDILYEDAGSPAPMRGRPAVREYLTATWRAVPDLRIELTDGPFIDPRKPMLASHWRATATHTGLWSPPGLEATGCRLSFGGADILEFREDKICRARVVYDVADIMQQLGVLSKPGSRGERMMIKFANLATEVRRRRRRRS